MTADFNVIVDVHAAFVERGDLVAASRQRPQQGLVQPLEPLAPVTLKLLERTLVQLRDQPSNRAVQFSQAVKALMAQPRQHPTFDDLHPHLDLRLILRLAWPRRQHGRRVVVHEVLRGAAQHRLVAVGPGDQRSRVVGHQQLGYPADKLQRIAQAADPVRRRLSARRAGERVIGRPKHRHEHVRLELDTPLGRLDRHCLPREVGEQLLAGPVLLAHRALERLGPVLVLLAELRVTVGRQARIALDIFLPQQLQRHALAAKLTVHDGVSRFKPGRRHRRHNHLTLQPSIQLVL